MSISLWVNNATVFASHPSAETVQKRIESEARIMELDVNFPVSSLCLPNDATMIVLSSDGPASEKAGSYLGQFEFDKTKNCWIQASSDRNHRNYQPIFIYKVDGDGWYVNNSLGKKKKGWLARTNTLPLAGWKVYGIEEDPTLSITIGAMEPNGDNVTITLSGKRAKEVPEVQGRYKKQNLMWQGHHVYKQSSNGFYLYVNGSSDGGYDCWAVGSELGGFRKLRGKV